MVNSDSSGTPGITNDGRRLDAVRSDGHTAIDVGMLGETRPFAEFSLGVVYLKTSR